MKIRPAGVELFHADRLRDMRQKVASLSFAKAPKNGSCYNHLWRSVILEPYPGYISLNSVRLTERKLFDFEQDGEGYWPTLSLRLRAENTHRMYMYLYILWRLKYSERYIELWSCAMRVDVKVSADSAASLLYTEYEGARSSVNSVTTMPQASTTQNTSYSHTVTYNSPTQLRQQHYFSSTF